MDMYTYKKISNRVSIINWPSWRWDLKNAMSYHNLKGTLFMRLWPKLSSFVLDRMDCVVCLNGFGSKGGFYLGTCEHIYHPIYLISLIVVCRCCTICKALLHERLYELFGLYHKITSVF